MSVANLRESCDEFFETNVTSFIGELQRLQDAIGEQAPQVDQQLADLTSAIRVQSRACLDLEELLGDRELAKEQQARFQAAIEPWFSQSWFMDRAKTKPRGYPGDYATLNGIYDNRTKGNGFGGYLDLYFLRSDLARAVRARMESVRQFLSEFIALQDTTETIRILNVASGPCREYFVGLEYPAAKRVHITCIDSDSEALAYVDSRAKSEGIRPSIQFVNYNALRMRSAKRNLEHFGAPDLIYSIGLFDYIPDNHLIAILRGLRETVRPGGVVYVAFKDELLYDKAEYQWFVDWFFFQRTEQDCRRLLWQAGFADDRIEVVRDETEIIISFSAHVPDRSDTQARIDAAHKLPAPTVARSPASEPLGQGD